MIALTVSMRGTIFARYFKNIFQSVPFIGGRLSNDILTYHVGYVPQFRREVLFPSSLYLNLVKVVAAAIGRTKYRVVATKRSEL
jgi:hypothetical protein